MQLCESCGACREVEWNVCPFCRVSLATAEVVSDNDAERFDALAAAAETSDLDLLPSPVAEAEVEAEPTEDLLTAQDLAHLTGDRGPAVNGWDSPAAAPEPAPASAEIADGIDAPVSKLIIAPLIAFALLAVAFVAYSILTASPTIRPDAVALIDATTTTTPEPVTTQSTVPAVETVGVDLAEQAAWLCSGDQFSIARAEAPSLAVYNDLLPATRDGREDWQASPDHVTLRDAVPPLVGCLSTADGGEIDRCPTGAGIISRRSVTWSYRVLRSTDGTELGADSGTAMDVRPCEQLVVQAEGSDMASWSPLPQDRLNAVAAAYTSAPHPQVACEAEKVEIDADADAAETTIAEPIEGLALDATFNGLTDSVVELPAGWAATEERPVEAVMCLTTLENDTSDDASDDAKTTDVADTTEACASTIRVTAVSRDGEFLGEWDHASDTCADERVTPPAEWWVDVVGPTLGYVSEPDGE